MPGSAGAAGAGGSGLSATRDSVVSTIAETEAAFSRAERVTLAGSMIMTFVPLLENPSITKGIAGFCVATAFGTLHQLLIQQVKAVSDKRLLGLSLPFTTEQIILSYGVNAAAINLLLTLAVGFLYSAFSLRLLLLWGIEGIAYFAVCCASVYDVKFKRGISTAANVLLFASVYYCLMI